MIAGIYAMGITGFFLFVRWCISSQKFSRSFVVVSKRKKKIRLTLT